ncbi:FtsW/RodA/SpoVE family cell cycle protein [Tepidimicrobium xylanilyticum]|uniref:Cell division protein FtsW, lipid II flippase n=1 Tax=Tepidimicrobium xylanilyticum TaxID=1123352 RepID=A0A1H3A713_9FIRM|nr:FtsW/RodA/SpoVE family cell cycle protein [Tepidimicrobium xylanilyticum]GMG96298.1 cell division protein FtsW [Tepidimicrobium xylanilyticum]SDX25403.1 cell division protein FtsW, lipid II flippase [Tepidimicrobium xylanilyticum]
MFNKRVSYKYPRNLLMLFELMALFLLFIYNKDNLNRFTFIYGLGLILIVYVSNFLLLRISTGDNYIFLIVTMLLSIGVIMIYRIDPLLGIKQILWIGMGIFIFFVTYLVFKNINDWEEWTLFYGIASIILFIITLLLGTRIRGAINWISIGGLSFQPSEIIKLLTIFLIGSYYARYEHFKERKYGSYYLMGIIYVFILFLFLQRDLGTVLILYSLFIALQFIYEEDRKLILINLLISIVSGILGYMMFPHVRTRFETWLNPWKYIDNKGYQITQSLFAIAEGGFFGTGIGLGHPDFIPEVHTDFIFSAICEEMGIFTGIGIIMLFLILVYRGFKIGMNQRNKFYRIIALGISILFGIQSFIIFGGALKMIPLTGITIPFVSYGGSSMLSSFIALGILQVASEELDFEEAKDG